METPPMALPPSGNQPIPVPQRVERLPVPAPPGSGVARHAGARTPTPAMGSHQRNQMALVKSRLVLVSALRDPRVAKLGVIARQAEQGVDPVEWLEREVQVDFSVAPEDLRISMSGLETDDLVVLVNAL